MTMEGKPDEELENKRVPTQEEEGDEEEDEPGVTPGGELVNSNMICLPSHYRFRK